MTAITAGTDHVPASVGARLIHELANRLSRPRLEQEIGKDLVHELEAARDPVSVQKLWLVLRTVFKYGMYDLLPVDDIASVSFDISAPINLTAPPVGFGSNYPVRPLLKRPTTIAGYPVDFPLALPASVLAANAKWIEFYGNRGFDILTYKTVRSVVREPHQWPNWVFLDNPPQLHGSNPVSVTGEPGEFPTDFHHVAMANSFGVPSLAPEWWQADIRRAKKSVRAGHQVLIVSVVATDTSTTEKMIEDFVHTARLAVDAGADIIEANYSCPNTPGDPAGLVYKSPDISARVSVALREALGSVPLFVKIGYLGRTDLASFVESNAKYIDGIVAINTISTEVYRPNGEPVFPGEGRKTAGVSGWAIKSAAQEVSRNLVELRAEIQKSSGKALFLLGLGGVLDRDDFNSFLSLGVDAVGTATGAYLNPYIGMDIRVDVEEEKRRPSVWEYGINVVSALVDEIVLHPTRPTFIKADHERRRVGNWYPEQR